MYINHIAILVNDLEQMKRFYQTFFDVEVSELYHNKKTQFRSYFLSFKTGARIELTNKPFTASRNFDDTGYTHLAISVGGKEDVDRFSERFVSEGYPLLSGPRTTGDGYYEAVVQDPEGNLIELTTE